MDRTDNVIDLARYRTRRQARRMAELMWAMYASRAGFGAARREQTARIALGVKRLDGALQRHQDQNDPQNARGAQSLSSSVKPAVKPGPSELTSARRHGVAKSRSSTNITVAADMLP